MKSRKTILIFQMIVLSVIFMGSIVLLPGEHIAANMFQVDGEYPDIKWKPRSYTVKPNSEPRYIDYENGNDSNPGTKNKPWKHHPWDKAAERNVANCRGIHTYYFKKGVIYRGGLTAKESGLPNDPIHLSMDPSWGKGKASIYGSLQIKDGWKQCNDSECLEIPSVGRHQTWYIDTDKNFVPCMLWEIQGDRVIRIPIARTPDWKIVDTDDPRSEWWELSGSILEVRIYLDKAYKFRVGDRITGTAWKNLGEDNNSVTEIGKDYIKIDAWNWKKGEIRQGSYITNGKIKAKVLKVSVYDVIFRLADIKHLSQNDPEYYVGATIWSEKESMPKPDADKVIGYDPSEHSLRVNYHREMNTPKKYDRYYLENLPKFLDSAGEFYYAEKGNKSGRVFIRLPEDRNPNVSITEAAKKFVLIDIKNKSNITISGIDLGFSNAISCGAKKARHSVLYASAIRIIGNCSNIRIFNSEISNAPAGVVAYPEKKEIDLIISKYRTTIFMILMVRQLLF